MQPAPKVRQAWLKPGTEEDRSQHEKRSAWSYHVAEGWKMIDNPLASFQGMPAAVDDLPSRLGNAGYEAQPSFTLGTGRVQALVHERLSTVEFLVVLTVGGRARHFLLARGFPSLLAVLRDLNPLLSGKVDPTLPSATLPLQEPDHAGG